MKFYIDESNKIIFCKRFANDKFVHGGSLRSDSIHRMLEQKYKLIHFIPKKKNMLLFLQEAINKTKWNSFSLLGMLRLLKDAACFPELKEFHGYTLYAEYRPGMTDLIFLLFKFKQKILLTHNVEFLVPFQESGYFNAEYRKIYEIKSWELADKIITNSNFDKNIIGNYSSTESFMINDYPSEVRLKILDKYREAKNKTENYFVAFGSANNPPTYTSLNRIRNYFTHIISDKQLIIFGNGTDKIKSSKNVSILGRLSDHEMFKLLLSCKAVVLDNIFTSGFLTKIYELNYLGVKVIDIGEYEQTRGLSEYGVFKNFDDFYKSKEIKKFKKDGVDALF